MNSEAKWPAHLVIVRHGESERNVAKAKSKRSKEDYYAPDVRDVDSPLTERGKQQGLETGKHLGARFRFDQVIASPYVRTVHTATLMASQLGYPTEIIEEERIREIEFGAFDGLTTHGLHKLFGSEMERKKFVKKYYFRPPGGESRPDVALRLHSFLATLTRENRGQSVLLVTHSVIVQMFRRLLERLNEAEFLRMDKEEAVHNCSVTHYACDPVSGKDGKLVLQDFNGIFYRPELSESDECRERAEQSLARTAMAESGGGHTNDRRE